jgi:hypothetical protein
LNIKKLLISLMILLDRRTLATLALIVAFPVLLFEGFIVTITTLQEMQLVDGQFSWTGGHHNTTTVHTITDGAIVFMVDTEKMAQTIAATVSLLIDRNSSVSVISSTGATFDTLSFVGIKQTKIRLVDQFDEEEIQSEVIEIIGKHAESIGQTRFTIAFVTRCDAPIDKWFRSTISHILQHDFPYEVNVVFRCIDIHFVNATHGMAESYLLGVNFDSGHRPIDYSVPEKYEYDAIDILLTLDLPTIAFLSRHTCEMVCTSCLRDNTLEEVDDSLVIVIGTSHRVNDRSDNITFEMIACKGVFKTNNKRARMRMLKLMEQYATYVYSDNISIVNMYHTTKTTINYPASTGLLSLMYNDSDKFLYSKRLIRELEVILKTYQ